MRQISIVQPAAALAACLALAACGGSGSSGDDIGARINEPPADSPTGTLSVALIDAPRWDVEAIWLDIVGINVKPSDDEPAHEWDFDPALEVDLLSLTADNAQLLLDNAALPAGEYAWIELEVDATFDESTEDSYVVDRSGGEVELRVPSGSVRLVSGFTITANRETSFLIDWDVRQGLVRPPGQDDRFMLRPAFRIIDMTEFGTLDGTVAMDLITPATEGNMCNADSVDDQNPDVGNVVYVFAGSGATPDDIDGIDEGTDPNVDPVATIEVEQDISGDYVYSTILTPGLYTVAFTCQGGLDDPGDDDELLFSDPVDIEVLAEDTETADF